MIPTLSLGPWDAPEFEIQPKDLNPIVALFIENFSAMSLDSDKSLFHFLSLDTLSLRDQSEDFFLKFESICRRIVSGEFVQYDIAYVQNSEFVNYFKGGVGGGVVTRDVKVAAQQFLNFLASHPDYWPLRRREPTAE